MTMQPIKLLVSANGKNPGEAFALEDWVSRAEFFVETSADYAIGTPTSPQSNSVAIQVATNDKGPWADIATISIPSQGSANFLGVEGIDDMCIPFIRAKLAASLGAGSVSVTACVRGQELGAQLRGQVNTDPTKQDPLSTGTSRDTSSRQVPRNPAKQG